jgi:hypothetical protein
MTPLESPQSYRDATPEERAAQSNGIGPEGWPEHLREFVTWLLGLYAPAAEIHDWEFGPAENNGEKWRWHQANERFRRNCKKLARAEYPIWRFLRRGAALKVADALYSAVESDSGWKAYLEACGRNQGAPTLGG